MATVMVILTVIQLLIKSFAGALQAFKSLFPLFSFLLYENFEELI